MTTTERSPKTKICGLADNDGTDSSNVAKTPPAYYYSKIAVVVVHDVLSVDVWEEATDSGGGGAKGEQLHKSECALETQPNFLP